MIFSQNLTRTGRQLKIDGFAISPAFVMPDLIRLPENTEISCFKETNGNKEPY